MEFQYMPQYGRINIRPGMWGGWANMANNHSPGDVGRMGRMRQMMIRSKSGRMIIRPGRPGRMIIRPYFLTHVQTFAGLGKIGALNFVYVHAADDVGCIQHNLMGTGGHCFIQYNLHPFP